MTLELVPFRGHTVPVLNGEISRYNVAELIAQIQYAQGYLGAPMPVTTYGNRPAEPITNSFQGFVEGMLYPDGPVAAAEAYRLRVFGQAPILYQELVDGRPGDLFDDDALDRLRAPWPGASLGDLMKRILIYGDFGGNGFILDIEDDLVLVRPDWVEFVLAKRMHRGGQVGWKQVGIVYYEGGLNVGDGVPFLPGEYSHFLPGLPDPLANYRGMSWLTPLVREVQADKRAHEHKLAYFENAASPNLAVSLPKEITPSQFEAFVTAMDEKHKGSQNAYKTLYTAGGADVTVIGANMQQMDFSSVIGKGETRIANAAGVPPTLLSFSEGMQGSSLNAGNYTAAKRNFVDTTMRDLWANFAGSLQQMDTFRPPREKTRLWYDGRDIPFLHEDAKDLAEIQQTRASTINSYITAGYKPETAVTAVAQDDVTKLEHTGLTSVQLMPPGSQDADGDGVADAEAQAGEDYEAALDEFRSELESVWEEIWRAERAANLAAHADLVAGVPPTFDDDDEDFVERRDYYAVRDFRGRFRKVSDRIGHALNEWLKGDGDADDPLEDFTREQLRLGAKEFGITPRRGASSDELKLALLKDARARFRGERDADADAPSGPVRMTLASPAFRDVDVGVYHEANGKVGIYRLSPTSQRRGAKVVSVDSLEALQQWGEDHGEPQVSSWAASERGVPVKKVAPRKAAPKKAATASPQARSASAADVIDEELASALLPAVFDRKMRASDSSPRDLLTSLAERLRDGESIDSFDDVVGRLATRFPSHPTMGGEMSADAREREIAQNGAIQALLARISDRVDGLRATRDSAPAKRNPRAKGADLTGGDLSAMAKQAITGARDSDSMDPQLSTIAARQGFDGRPTVVSKREMDRLVADGATPMYRGQTASETVDGDSLTAAEVNEQLRTGPAFYGTGQAGPGYYLSSHEATVEDYADGTPGSVVKAVLRPDARRVSMDEIEAQRVAYLAGLPEDDWATESLLSTPAHFAAAKGYDVVDIPDPGGGEPWHVVVNRTALVVESGAAARSGPAKKATKAAPKPRRETARQAAQRVAIADAIDAELAMPMPAFFDEKMRASDNSPRDMLTNLVASLREGDPDALQSVDVTIGSLSNRHLNDSDVGALVGRIYERLEGIRTGRAPTPAKKAAKKAVPAPSTDPTLDLSSLRAMPTEARRDALDERKVPELKAMLKAEGLPVSGRKRELVDRLVAKMDADAPKADAPDAAPNPDAPDVEPPAETAARTRQATVDRARSVSGLLRDVDEFLTNGASDKALEARIRSRSEVAGTPPELRDALLANVSDRDALRRVLDSAASDAGLRPIDAAGTRTTFDPARHEALDGRIPAGTPVRVTRQGYVATVDGDEVVLDRAMVMADDGGGGAGPKGDGPTGGRDLLGDDAAGGGTLAADVVAGRDAFTGRSRDPALSVIAERQGFDGLPEVVSREELDRRIKAGAPLMLRGVQPIRDEEGNPVPGSKTPLEMLEEFRSGGAHFGTGVYGNGFYFAPTRKTTHFTNARNFAADGGALMRATLHPDARVVMYRDLQREHDAYFASLGYEPARGRFQTPRDEQDLVYGDIGRFAAARGYDVVQMDHSAAGGYIPPQWLVLNRSVVVVEEAR